MGGLSFDSTALSCLVNNGICFVVSILLKYGVILNKYSWKIAKIVRWHIFDDVS